MPVAFIPLPKVRCPQEFLFKSNIRSKHEPASSDDPKIKDLQQALQQAEMPSLKPMHVSPAFADISDSLRKNGRGTNADYSHVLVFQFFRFLLVFEVNSPSKSKEAGVNPEAEMQKYFFDHCPEEEYY
ncbi:MAG: hypothetical protein Q9200_004538, partial [Gallowayella weberi]